MFVVSGGHTAEMLSLVRSMNLQQYAPRYYIAGATDKMSLSRAERDEAQLLQVHDEMSQGLSQGFRIYGLEFDDSLLLAVVDLVAGVLKGSEIWQNDRTSEMQRIHFKQAITLRFTEAVKWASLM